tara:strand:- start:118 stop:573 length:456 start_codon:yes stop_codon:yes gene_type:complete
MDKINLVQNIKDLQSSVSDRLTENIKKFVDKNKNIQIETFSTIGSPFCSTEAFCGSHKEGFVFENKNKEIVNDILDFRSKTNNTSFEDNKVKMKDCGCDKIIEGYANEEELTKNEMKNHADKNFKRHEFDFYLYIAATGVAILAGSMLARY